MLVCMSVILSACISQKHVQTSQNFLYILPVAMAHISCNDSELCYVFPVLWMTSCSAILGHMASGIFNVDVGDMLKQVVVISNIFTRWRHTV